MESWWRIGLSFSLGKRQQTHRLLMMFNLRTRANELRRNASSPAGWQEKEEPIFLYFRFSFMDF
jgi:hypothetical protein